MFNTQKANRYFTQLEPWSDETSAEDTAKVVIYAKETLRISSILLQPIMPSKCSELLDRLDIDPSCRSFQNADISINENIIDKPVKKSKQVLFPPVVDN